MAENNLEKKPSKGILKSSSSFEQPDAPAPVKKKHKETKWDEMNIIATLHPADKDYGHMKIEEPKTPYNWEEGAGGAEGGEEPDGIDANLLAEKIRLGANEPAKVFRESDEDEDEDEDDEETPEDKAQRKVFESKRKAHYNEYYAVKLARKLMDKDGGVDEDEDEDEDEDTEEKADSEPSEKAPTTAKCCKTKSCRPTCSHKHVRKSSPPPSPTDNDVAGSSRDADKDGCDV